MKRSILIIYTGGTIGMVNDPQTGALCPFDFEHIAKEVPEIQEFGYNIESYTLPKIIDSSDVNPNLWTELCNIIYNKYDDFDGFVVLHGTDTMAYSASALSFMMDNLEKPVVFTGSQLPIGTIRTDGKENLLAALEIAAAEIEGKSIVPEVSILFGDRLLRGNRTTKINSESFDAFKSFNYPQLAEIGIHINYNYGSINYAKRSGKLSIHTNMDTNIAILKIFPGISPNLMDSIIETPGIRGIVLESFGSGNAPTSKEFLQKIKKATDKNLIIYNVTQCKGGSVEMGRYEASREMLNYGVISGHDITLESAICKMMYVLGNSKDNSVIKKTLNSCIKGEISVKNI